MKHPVLGLYQRWIGKGFIISLCLPHVPFPFPRRPLVFGQRNSQTMPAVSRIVIGHHPMPILKYDHFQAGSRIRDGGVLRKGPRFTLICGSAQQHAIGRNAPIGLRLALKEDSYLSTDATSFYLKKFPSSVSLRAHTANIIHQEIPLTF